MNLQQTEEKPTELVLSSEPNVTELLRLAKLLHGNPAWRTTLFSGEYGPSNSARLIEARWDILCSICNLEKILEEVKKG